MVMVIIIYMLAATLNEILKFLINDFIWFVCMVAIELFAIIKPYNETRPFKLT